MASQIPLNLTSPSMIRWIPGTACGIQREHVVFVPFSAVKLQSIETYIGSGGISAAVVCLCMLAPLPWRALAQPAMLCTKPAAWLGGSSAWPSSSPDLFLQARSHMLLSCSKLASCTIQWSFLFSGTASVLELLMHRRGYSALSRPC